VNRRAAIPAFLAVAVLLWAAQAPASDGQQLVVFAATSLREACQSLALAFEKQHPDVKVRFNFAGSQDLSVQIENGARADVFASADWKHMRSLLSEGTVAAPTVFARNLPVVIVPKDAPNSIATFADLPKATRLVLGAPEVPIGAYAETILLSAEMAYGKAFADKVRANVRSRELNVRQVLTKVAMGEGDAGIVYRTDALIMPDKVRIIEIPSALNVVADYPIAVLKATPHADLASAFVKLVLSREGEKVLTAAGFSQAASKAKPKANQ
jgi:molybdate transport system substrate-binding protein